MAPQRPTEAMALSVLYIRYSNELINFVRRKIGNGPPEAQDVVQQAFTNFAALERPEEIKNPRAFLYRTVLNIAIDQGRQQKRHQRLDAFIGTGQVCDILEPERQLIGREELQTLEKTILALSQRDRTFFLLNRLEDVSCAEIARRTNMSASGVRFIIEGVVEKCQIALKKAQHNGGAGR